MHSCKSAFKNFRQSAWQSCLSSAKCTCVLPFGCLRQSLDSFAVRRPQSHYFFARVHAGQVTLHDNHLRKTTLRHSAQLCANDVFSYCQSWLPNFPRAQVQLRKRRRGVCLFDSRRTLPAQMVTRMHAIQISPCEDEIHDSLY